MNDKRDADGGLLPDADSLMGIVKNISKTFSMKSNNLLMR